MHFCLLVYFKKMASTMSQFVSDEEPAEDEESKSPGGGDGDSLVDGRTAQTPTSQGDVPQALGGWVRLLHLHIDIFYNG